MGGSLYVLSPILEGFGHFVPEHMGRVEFPEILEEVR